VLHVVVPGERAEDHIPRLALERFAHLDVELVTAGPARRQVELVLVKRRDRPRSTSTPSRCGPFSGRRRIATFCAPVSGLRVMTGPAVM
jgi:hypothetical protein